MIPFSLAIRPGVDTQRTPLAVGNGVISSNLIRHRNALIEKLGGCLRLASATFAGICRALFPWQDLAGNHYLAIGTDQFLEVLFAGQINVISPIVRTSNLSAGFATAIGSATVSITDGGYTPAVGSWVDLANALYLGGLYLQGPYQVQSVAGSTYTITASAPATATASGAPAVVGYTTTSGSAIVGVMLGGYAFAASSSLLAGVSTTVGGLTLLGSYTVSAGPGPVYTITGGSNASSSASGSENGGSAQVLYYLALPNAGAASGSFGAGAFGLGPFGVGSAGQGGNEGSEPAAMFLVEWSMDRWGQNLVCCYVGGTIYQWVPPVAAGNVAAAVSGAPANVNGLFVAAPQQQVMAWGLYSSTLGEQDPLIVGFCDVANLNAWTASVSNQAGSFRLSSGSLILGGTWFGPTGLLWTDLDIWAMSYIGYPLVYGFNKIAPNCGLISRRAWATLGSQCVWLSQQDFFMYQGGQVAPMLCTVRDFIFNSLDPVYLENIHADTNTYGNEVTWWFPQIGSNGACTGAVKYHAAGGEWDITSSGLSLSAWCDQSVMGPPIGAFYNGTLQQFETAADFDGQILDCYFVSGFFQMAEGEEFVYVDRVYPDFTLSTGAQVQMTFTFADNMAEAANPALTRVYGPYTVTAATEYLIVRGRGRVMQLRVDCNTVRGAFFRYGHPLATISIDGRAN